MIRSALTSDIARLVAIEQECFATDRLSRRNFVYLLTKAHALTVVEERAGFIRGYAMILLSKGVSTARLYSIAVAKDFQKQGVADSLLQALEERVLALDYLSLRLEIRKDNVASQSFFKKHGYKKFGVIAHYYEDREDALRFEKMLAPHLDRSLVRVPYYQQSQDFTCGPAALLMAMSALNEEFIPSQKLELRIWREATTIYMTSGHGGCSPYGLALSAYQRGYDVEIYVNYNDAMFLDSVRNPGKKNAMRLVQEDFMEQVAQLPIVVTQGGMNMDTIKAKFEEGGIPIVLVSYYRIYREKFPHWVVVTGYDEKYVYVHDPLVNDEVGEVMTDSINMPIQRQQFLDMTRYGKSRQKAALIVKKRRLDAF